MCTFLSPGASANSPKNQVAVQDTLSGSSPVSARRTPLGRPDVPEGYIMGAPAVRGSGRPSPSAPRAASGAKPGTAPPANLAPGSIAAASAAIAATSPHLSPTTTP